MRTIRRSRAAFVHVAVAAAVVMATLASVVSVGAPASAAAPSPRPAADSGPAVHHDTSPPLRDENQQGEGDQPVKREKPDKRDGALPPHQAASTPDPVVQSTRAPAVPSTASSFDGVGQGFTGPAGTFTVNAAPPDTNSAVGPNHIVEIVNTSFAVFSKSGSVLYGPAADNVLWSGFGGHCQTDNDGDPVVRYDSISDRWILSQFANAASNTGPYYECVAVSQTGDPTGAYYRYAFQYANFPDYPKVGVWPDAYYMTLNLFSGNNFLGSEACAYDRARMLTGANATQQCFVTTSLYGGLLPADLDGTTKPPTGAPNLLVSVGPTATTLAYWKLHVDWSTPANSTFTGPGLLNVASYNEACGGGTCIPQLGTTTRLDSLADRLMFRLAYRNFGDHEALVVSHSVTAGSSAGVRWYELRLSGGNPTVYQQSTYAPDAAYRWMPSIAMDAAGNIGVGFSVSSGSLHPAVKFTGRLAGDPLSQMTQGEGTIVNGAGSQTGGLTRWGDYSSMSVDPADGCTFWYSNEYIPSNGSFNWRTRLGSFRLPGCGSPPPANDFSIAVSPSSGTVTAGGSTTATVSTTLTSGSAQTVSLSASGLPSGATASFNPASVTAGGSSTMTIATSTSTPAGTSSVTVTGTGTSATHSATYSLTVNAPAGGGIVNGGFESGTFSGWTRSGSTSITTAGPHGGTYAAFVGSASPTSGNSSISQTFTAPAGVTRLAFWYAVTCPDTLTYDWATATLKDQTTGVTTTPLARTCTNNQGWKQVSVAVTAGHTYTLTLISHDDNYPGDATFTKFDDVVFS